MADIFSGFTLLEQFSGLLSVFLVLLVVYAILQYTKMLGNNKFLHALIALMIAAIFGFSRGAQQVLSFAAPWFTILFFFIIFMIMAFKIFGASDADVLGVLRSDSFRFVAWWIVAFAVIIALFAFSGVFGQGLLKIGAGGGSTPARTQYMTVDGQVVVSDQVTVIDGVPYLKSGEELIIVSDGTVIDTEAGVNSNDFQSNLYNTLFHPKVLGMIFIMLVATFTMRAMVNT